MFSGSFWNVHVLLDVKNFLDVKNVKILHFCLCSSKSKKEECDQKVLNIYDQIKTLLLSSTIYFLGMSARLSQKLSTENSSLGKKTSRFTIFEGRSLK